MHGTFKHFRAVAGRTDVRRRNNDFAFTPTMKSAFKNFTVVDDDVLEFDEVFMAEFDFGPELSNNWNISKGTPSVLYCLIRDDDCEFKYSVEF